MEAAGAAVGIASLGIQVCQGLLDYYDGWKGYPTDIAGAYNSIADLNTTLALLKVSLDDKELDHDRAERAKEALENCKDGLMKLSKKLQKLQTHDKPQGSRQRLWAEFQRGSYPFKASTLAKLREIVDEVMERLKLALQVLQLDVTISSQKTLLVVAADTKETAKRTAFIESAVTDISTQTQQLLASKQSDQFKKITHWLSPPDPLTNHFSARQRHEPHTGAWLLDHKSYLNWKTGAIKHLWMYGKAGCGKTVLSSTTIEDMQRHCGKLPNVGHAIFYFSFSDDHKQSYENMISSVTAQLAWKDPGLSMLQQAYEKLNATRPSIKELENIVVKSIQAYDTVYLQLDALDECPESNDIRQHVLDGLKRLSQRAPSLGIFATSRELRDVHETMDNIGADSLLISTHAVDLDIQRYVSVTVSHDPRLGRLSPETKILIQDTIAQKADGMFRWAYCQLQELKKLKSTKPKYVKDALLSLPSTLDETYERMLTGIEERYRDEALTLLQWITYARSPLTLGELAEVTIINPEGTGSVDFDERGDIEDTLDILSGLITVVSEAEPMQGNEEEQWTDDEDPPRDSASGIRVDPDATTFVDKLTRVRLAHFSVQEYLESRRIRDGKAKDFSLVVSMGHTFLAHSCLTYLEHYSASGKKTSTKKDLSEYPLLKYAAKSWYHYSSLRQDGEVAREVSFLLSEQVKDDWRLVYRPDRDLRNNRPFEGNPPSAEERRNNGPALYHASVLGLEVVASALIDGGAQINERGGYFGNALQAASQAASRERSLAIVRMLLDAGAEVNAQGGHHGNALQAAASMPGCTEVVQILLDAGANVNAQGGKFGNALQAASFGGSQSVVKLLLDAGADVNAQGGYYCNALLAASYGGSKSVVKLLLEAGADVNAQGGSHGNALQAASFGGSQSVVKLLLDAGAGVNAQGGYYCNALLAASYGGSKSVVKLLLEAGADVNAQGGSHGHALQAASFVGSLSVVKLLLDAGADVNAQSDGLYSTALEAAVDHGHTEVAQKLIDAGADVNDPEGGISPLLSASLRGWKDIVRSLLDKGADVNAQASEHTYRNALEAASVEGHEEVVQMLIDAGADISAHSYALLEASFRGHGKIVRILLEAGADVNALGQWEDPDLVPWWRFATALEAATSRGHEDVVRLLIDAGADVNIRFEKSKYRNALEAAEGNETIKRMLIDAGAVQESDQLDD
ncbi:unnamed protein product [Zymoseptoria tritici ST99CH_3D1]|nr:unnamed protein product [Zymoseptoria tritici ST99CH_3D1]